MKVMRGNILYGLDWMLGKSETVCELVASCCLASNNALLLGSVKNLHQLAEHVGLPLHSIFSEDFPLSKLFFRDLCGISVMRGRIAHSYNNNN